MRRLNWCGASVLLIAISLATTLASADTIYNPSLTGGSYHVITADDVIGNSHTGAATNFEDGTNLVFTSHVDHDFDASSVAPIIGSYSAVTNTTLDGSGPGYASQLAIPVIAGHTYIVSAFFNRGDNLTGISTGGLYIDLNGANGQPVDIADLATAGNQFVYESYTATVTDAITLRLVRDGPRLAGEKAYVDNIGFTPVANFAAPGVASAVPLPPALYAGIALMSALGLMQYKQQRRAKLA